MKRNILLSLICMSVIATLHAAPITYRQAAEQAARFLSLKQGKKFSRTDVVNAQNDKGIEPYYVFNMENNEGFVIVAGDNAVRPILGYSCHGNIEKDDLPDNMKMWLDGCADDIRRIQKLNMPAAKHKSFSYADRENIPALITSRWNQKRPFNKRCPKSKNGKGNRPAGCVAIAMAQVMYYHKWPLGETAAIDGYSYKDEYKYGGDDSMKSVEPLEPTVFDWDYMLDGYEDENNYTEKSADAVAELLQYVGHSVKMVYGVKASAAFSDDIPVALACIFGYKNTVRLVRRADYDSQKTWEDLIYKELIENRPVVYSGISDFGSGHQFVCDGYENGYFHINWGWGGMSDGFFLLSVLDPYDQGIGGGGTGTSFSRLQTAVIGIERPYETDTVCFSDILAIPGEQLQTEIKMSNVYTNYTSLQFDIQLPKGAEIWNDASGKPSVSFNKSRSEKGDHVVSVHKIADNMYRCVVYSPTNSSITQKEGTVINIGIKINDNMPKGSYHAIISNITVCDQNLKTKKLCDSKSAVDIVVDKALMGDSNNDGKVDRNDVDWVIQNIMQKKNEPFIRHLADIDADGVIDIADAMLTQNIFLGNSGADCNKAFIEPESKDSLYLSAYENTLAIILTNRACYKALQIDVVLPQNTSVTDIITSVERTNEFNVVYRNINDVYRIVLYSPEGRNIDGSEGSVADIILNTSVAEAEIKNIIMITSDLKKVKSGRSVYKLPLAIENLENKVYTDNGIYNLDGLRMNKNIEQLERGIYIVKGKKTVIR